ncbi:hypothetical protein ACJROX_29375 [Pseudalkalibacillus sp. A8]|uniref:hypothetical protein n=1 Tax=Pseudalkalibacillus sp. A8 TaxID=3382641 RepID=UPI0038B6695A
MLISEPIDEGERGLGFMMSEFVTYFLVIWLSMVCIARIKHQDLNDKQNGYLPDRVPFVGVRKFEAIILNRSVYVFYRLKRHVLWDTS